MLDTSTRKGPARQHSQRGVACPAESDRSAPAFWGRRGASASSPPRSLRRLPPRACRRPPARRGSRASLRRWPSVCRPTPDPCGGRGRCVLARIAEKSWPLCLPPPPRGDRQAPMEGAETQPCGSWSMPRPGVVPRARPQDHRHSGFGVRWPVDRCTMPSHRLVGGEERTSQEVC